MIQKKTRIDLINSVTALKSHCKYKYFAVVFIMLGQILEFINTKTYDTILTEKIIEPLQLARTLTKTFNLKNTATGYNSKGVEQKLFNRNITVAVGLLKSIANAILMYLSRNSAIDMAVIKTEQAFYEDSKIDIGLGITSIDDRHVTKVYAK